MSDDWYGLHFDPPKRQPAWHPAPPVAAAPTRRQLAQAAIEAGKTVIASWPTPHSHGHITRLMLRHVAPWHCIPLEAELTWDEPVPAVVAEPVPERVLSAAERGKAFLATELAVDPVPTVELQERALKAGISWSTVRRVRHAAGVSVFKDGRGAWMWSLREGD
jgi:hypothetical protein